MNSVDPISALFQASMFVGRYELVTWGPGYFGFRRETFA